MTFWKALRWISSIVFFVLLIAVWLSGGQSTGTEGGAQPLPPAPTIVR